MKRFLYLFLPFLFVLVLGRIASSNLRETRDEPVVIQGYQPWPKEVIAAARTIPVQSGGRVMPLDSYARFTLYELSARNSVSFVDGKREENESGTSEQEVVKYRLEPIEWLLDVLFRPHFADDMPVLLVDNPEVFSSLGLAEKLGKKRDRFAMAGFREAFARLDQLAEQLRSTPEDSWDAQQRQISQLWEKVARYNRLFDNFVWAKVLPIQGTSLWGQAASLKSSIPMLTTLQLAQNPEFIDAILRPDSSSMELTEQQTDSIQELGVELDLAFVELTSRGKELVLFPPASIETLEWQSAGGYLEALRSGAEVDEEQILSQLKLFESLASSDELEQQGKLLLQWRKDVASLVDKRQDTKNVKSESLYYKIGLLQWSQIGFWLLFVCMLVLMLCAKQAWTQKAASFVGVFALIPILLLCVAISWRCFLRDRPPVTNLYDTFLFVTAVATLVGWVVEQISGRRIALLLTSMLGILGLVAAIRFEIGMGVDTSAPEVAVLDSDFWLTIHVLTIAVGYSAAVLAAAIAMSWIFIRAIEGPKHELLKPLNTSAYAITCFGVLFTTVGTILGGVWANESWGRFWGWDPKENGALMIVLAQLAVLHGRLGGILKPILFQTAIVFTGIITLFSWFHVNLLGIGLHAYGHSKTQGLRDGLYSGYSILALFVVLGLLLYFFDSRGKKKPTK